MPISIKVGQTEALYVYALTFPDGKALTVAVTPLMPDVAGRVIGTLTEEYSMIIPISPRGTPWAFLRGYMPGVAYVQQQMQLPSWASSLLARIMPQLAAAAPADDILAAAQVWYDNPHGV